MSKYSPSPDSIANEAAAWLVERDDGFEPGRAEEFRRWCAADERHAAAVARLEQAGALLGKMPRLRSHQDLLRRLEDAPVRPAPVVPVYFRSWAAVAAAVVFVAAGCWWLWPAAATEARVYATAARGYESVTLPDGSVVELNADSAVEVRYTPAQRLLTLRRGEAHFTVAKNPARPFIVTAGRVRLRAVGTAFNVRLDPERVQVLVTEGRIVVAEDTDGPLLAPRPTGVLKAPLSAGQITTVAATGPIGEPRIETAAPAVVRELLAWQPSRMVLSGTPLAEVVARFNLRNRVQLVIGDAALARRPVGGVFEADNVETFVRLLVDTGEVAAERPEPNRIVLRQPR